METEKAIAEQILAGLCERQSGRFYTLRPFTTDDLDEMEQLDPGVTDAVRDAEFVTVMAMPVEGERCVLPYELAGFCLARCLSRTVCC